MPYEIVKYHPELKSQIMELQLYLWGPDFAENVAHFEWKYEWNPYIDMPLIYVALYEGQVVGMRGVYGAKWQIGSPSQTFLVPCAGDLVIAPAHRNRGLFTQIMQVALNDLDKRGYAYIFNFSAGRITYISSLGTGWRSTEALKTMQWKGQTKTTWRRWQRKILPLRLLAPDENPSPFYFLDRNSRRRRGKVNPCVSVAQTPQPEAMAQLLERMGSDGRIRHIRDQQYFAWRFLNPRSVYRFLFWEGERLEGYLILQARRNKEKQGIYIVDWEATDSQVRADLLQAAMHWGNFHTLHIWSATFSHEAEGCLQETGFRLMDERVSVKQRRHTILIRPVRNEMLKTDWTLANRQLLDINNWYIHMIYSDAR